MMMMIFICQETGSTLVGYR